MPGAQRAVSGWTFPRAYLDFETIAFPVPRWLGTKPWEQVPFQFSLHVEDSSGSIHHREFLSLGGNDPRRACVEELIANVPETGAVIAFNAGFERSCITRLADYCPDLADRLMSIAERVVDLLPVTRNHWYHRDQQGSWSIKAVLPTIPGASSYADRPVGDGSAARAAFLEALNPQISSERREKLEQALKNYCAKDTWAMIEVLRHLVSENFGASIPN